MFPSESNQAADLIQNPIWLRPEIGQPKFDTFKNQATELARAKWRGFFNSNHNYCGAKIGYLADKAGPSAPDREYSMLGS